MMLTEIGSLTVRDYLREDGSVRASSEVRAAIAYNNNARILHWSSPRVVAALDAYLVERVRLSHGLTVRKAAFRGLDPDGPLFRRGDGEPFQLTARKTSTGTLSYSCDSLSQLYRKLHSQAGLHGPNVLAGRRTFAVRLHRKGFDLKLISELLGLATLSATKRLIDGDPVKLGAIVAGIV